MPGGGGDAAFHIQAVATANSKRASAAAAAPRTTRLRHHTSGSGSGAAAGAAVGCPAGPLSASRGGSRSNRSVHPAYQLRAAGALVEREFRGELQRCRTRRRGRQFLQHQKPEPHGLALRTFAQRMEQPGEPCRRRIPRPVGEQFDVSLGGDGNLVGLGDSPSLCRRVLEQRRAEPFRDRDGFEPLDRGLAGDHLREHHPTGRSRAPVCPCLRRRSGSGRRGRARGRIEGPDVPGISLGVRVQESGGGRAVRVSVLVERRTPRRQFPGRPRRLCLAKRDTIADGDARPLEEPCPAFDDRVRPAHRRGPSRLQGTPGPEDGAIGANKRHIDRRLREDRVDPLAGRDDHDVSTSGVSLREAFSRRPRLLSDGHA